MIPSHTISNTTFLSLDEAHVSGQFELLNMEQVLSWKGGGCPGIVIRSVEARPVGLFVGMQLDEAWTVCFYSVGALQVLLPSGFIS
jgi:hypothetical protein